MNTSANTALRISNKIYITSWCQCCFLCCGCISGSYHCIVACALLGKGTDHRTATMAAPQLLTSGPAMYEEELHRNLLKYFCACMQRDVCRERSGLNQINVSLCCIWREKSLYVEGVLRGELG